MRIIRIFAALLVAISPVLAEEETRDDSIDDYFAQAAGEELPWVIEGGLGFTYKDGNSEVLNFALRGKVEKKWAADLLRFTLQSIYAENAGVESTSEHILVQRYEHYMGEKHRIWQQLWLETDSQESLSLRFVLTAGYGYRFVKNENFELWGEVGGGWSSETFYGGASNDEGIAQININWTWQITKALKYIQNIQFWPSLSNGGEWKMIWDSQFIMPVSDRWSFALIVQDQYNSDPPAGNEKNDFTIIFTLNFDFTKKPEKKE